MVYNYQNSHSGSFIKSFLAPYKLKSVIVCFFLLCFQHLHAQKKIDSVYNWGISIGANAGRATVIDKNFSSLPFYGNYLGLKYALFNQGAKFTHLIEISYKSDTLKNKYSNKVAESLLNLDYTSLFHLNHSNLSNAIKVYVGGSLNGVYATRNYTGFVNNNDSYESILSLSAACKIKYSPKGKLAGFSISDDIRVPLASSIGQPSFGSESPTGSTHVLADKSLFKNHKIGSFGDYLRAINSITVEKTLKKRQRVALLYTIDYYHVKTERDVRQLIQGAELIYSYLF